MYCNFNLINLTIFLQMMYISKTQTKAKDILLNNLMPTILLFSNKFKHKKYQVKNKVPFGLNYSL